MILHLLSDPDFALLIMNQMEECFPQENIFLFLSGNLPLGTPNPNFTNRTFFEGDLSVIDFSIINGTIIHYLSIKAAKVIKEIPKDIPIAYSIWGGDFYDFLPEFKQKLMEN